MLKYSFPRLFVPWNIRSRDGTFVLGTIRSLELSFPRRINTADISLLGPFVPWTVHSLKLSFQVPAVRSVTLNLANKFSQCTFSVTEHYDLFSDLVILRQA